MGTPAGDQLDRLNDAFNALHSDVCGRGLRGAVDGNLCADVIRSRAAWRQEWQSYRSVTVASDLWRKWHRVFLTLRARAVHAGVPLPTTPTAVVSPGREARRRVERGAERALDVGQSFLLKAALVAGAVYLVTRMLDDRRPARAR